MFLFSFVFLGSWFSHSNRSRAFCFQIHALAYCTMNSKFSILHSYCTQLRFVQYWKFLIHCTVSACVYLKTKHSQQSLIRNHQSSLENYTRSYIRTVMQIFTSTEIITANDSDSLSDACGDILSLQIQRGCVESRDLVTLQRTAKQDQRVFKKSVQV